MKACDSVIVPLHAEPFATDGLVDLLQTIASSKNKLNLNLNIEGILIPMTDTRTNLSSHICNEDRYIYIRNKKIPIYCDFIYIQESLIIY